MITQFTQWIIDGKNFSFVKMGDGEILCMSGVQGENCDRHPYSPELGNKLREAYLQLNKMDNVYISGWHDPKYPAISPVEIKDNISGEIFLHNSIDEDKYLFYKALKMSPRKKVYIGPENLSEVKSFLNTEMVVIPQVNCFSFKFNIEPEDDTIYLFTAGMASKVWIAELLRKNKNITCLDLGSALNPIFTGQNRTRQIDKETLRIFYRELL